MKKLVLLISLLAIFTVAAGAFPLMRLEIVNKSAYPAYFALHQYSPSDTPSYYLKVDAASATTGLWGFKSFTILKGYYNLSLSACGVIKPYAYKVDLSHNVRIIIPACNVIPAPGDESVYKLSPLLYNPADPSTHIFGTYRY